MNTTNSRAPTPSSDSDYEVFIFEDGVAFVFEDDLYALLQPIFDDLRVSRAGHVEPCHSGWSIDLAPACRTLGLPEPNRIELARRDEALKTEAAAVKALLSTARSVGDH